LTSLGLKSLWARKVRALTTAFAVVLGVAFVAGSYILTDTIFAAFDEIFSESLKGTSVVITAENPVKQENGETPTIEASLLPTVQKTRGVRLAAGAIFTPGGFAHARRPHDPRQQRGADGRNFPAFLFDRVLGGDDDAGSLQRLAEDLVEGGEDRVGEDEGAGDEGDAEEDGEARQQGPDLASPEALEAEASQAASAAR
jgi:hypothetical protein